MPDDESSPPAPDDEPVTSPEIVMFFLGPDGQPLDGDPDTATRQRTVGELYRAWRAALDDEREREDYRRHRPGDRKVQGIGRPARTGYRDEIVVTLRSDPMRAVTEAIGGAGVFQPPIARLDVDEASRATTRYELRWPVTIRVWPWQRRRAVLRLYASPSLNVSVLSLLPERPRSIARTRFLRVGLRVMNELRDRVDARVDAGTASDGHTAAAATAPRPIQR